MGSTIPRVLAACAVFVGTAGGCGSHATFEFDALDLAPPQEELSEFLLGQYSIPIPVVVDRGPNERTRQNRYQLDFELYALVRPENKSNIADDWARHEGIIRDRVIRVCRNATVEELQEPELSTLKARLMDALAAQVGEKDVRQLLITEVVSQAL
jgi:hypothetical protein